MPKESRILRAATRTTRSAPAPDSPVNAPRAELEDIHQWMQDKNLVDSFNQLPPPEDYTFEPLGDGLTVKSEGTLSSLRLFLGEEIHDANHQPVTFETWALLETFPDKNIKTKVVFMNFNTKMRRWERFSHFNEIYLQYPFQVFKDKKNNRMIDLNSFIAFVFLECFQESSVFFTKLEDEKAHLEKAIKTIMEVYNKLGGVEQVPSLQKPGYTSKPTPAPRPARTNPPAPQEASESSPSDFSQPSGSQDEGSEQSPSPSPEQAPSPRPAAPPQARYNMRLRRLALEGPSEHETDSVVSQISQSLQDVAISSWEKADPRSKRPRDSDTHYQAAKRLRLAQREDDLNEREQRRAIAVARDRSDAIKYRRRKRRGELRERLERLTRKQLVGLILDEGEDESEDEEEMEE